eukprot:GHVU01038687.1.p3 GENE.GHVU01038687.1~~GHVU01038687.1.p3  ORF type:complete len:120 (-),score=23.23 GHVU01038687.1:289-648(-)
MKLHLPPSPPPQENRSEKGRLRLPPLASVFSWVLRMFNPSNVKKRMKETNAMQLLGLCILLMLSLKLGEETYERFRSKTTVEVSSSSSSSTQVSGGGWKDAWKGASGIDTDEWMDGRMN